MHLPHAHGPCVCEVKHRALCLSCNRHPVAPLSPEIQEEPFGVPGPSAASLCLLLGKQGRDLWSALKQPMVLRPTAFLVFTGCLPTAGAAMFFFFTEHLHFSAEFLGHMQVLKLVY